MRLSDLDADAELEVSDELKAALQEMARKFPREVEWIIYDLCSKDRFTFRPFPGLDVGLVMVWLDGCRSRGVLLHRIITTPIKGAAPAEEPPARTFTGQARQRRKKSQQEG